MRRLLLLLTTLLLTLSAAHADMTEDIGIPADCLATALLDTEASPLTADTVIDMTLQALMAHYPDRTDLLTLSYLAHANRVQLTDGRTAWIGSIFTQQGETPIEAVLTVDEATYAVLRYEENNTGWFRDTQARWEAAYGHYGTWPLNTQVLFDVLYCLEVTHATLPDDDCLPEYAAFELALEAAGLANSRDTLRCERTLIFDLYATDPTAQYVWMITLCLGTQDLAQVNISAVDGHIIDIFDLRADVG